MTLSTLENLFTIFNETASILQEELDCTYLEALAETGENLFHGDILQEELSELTVKRLQKSYEAFGLSERTSEEVRKAFQLAILKGMKENVQPNHQMTPDAVGMFVGYLVDKFVSQKSYRLLDPAVGTGNLLTTVMNLQTGKELEAAGVDVDDLLIKLAYVNANLQQHPIQLFNQDSLEPLFVDPVDVIVCDLPVGYYPNDVRANDYMLKSSTGHSFAHHLFIEQSVKHTKEGGYLFFIIPNRLFESEEAPKLHEYLKQHAHIQAILPLPMTMFKNEAAAKSILVLQKQGEGTKNPKQVLLANLPSFSKMYEVDKILRKIEAWIKEQK